MYREHIMRSSIHVRRMEKVLMVINGTAQTLATQISVQMMPIINIKMLTDASS